jgi:hypothetical protein
MVSSNAPGRGRRDAGGVKTEAGSFFASKPVTLNRATIVADDVLHGVSPMFTVAAFLPFLSLIVDTHIQQMGDDDFQKREASTRFLERMLQDTDGLSNYWVLVKVEKATTSQNQENRMRARHLYKQQRERFFLSYPYICFVIDDAMLGKTEKWELASKLLKPIISEVYTEWITAGGWGTNSRGYQVAIATKNIGVAKLRTIRARAEVVALIPLHEKLTQITPELIAKWEKK